MHNLLRRQQLTEWVKLRVKNSHELNKVPNHAYTTIIIINLHNCSWFSITSTAQSTQIISRPLRFRNNLFQYNGFGRNNLDYN